MYRRFFLCNIFVFISIYHLFAQSGTMSPFGAKALLGLSDGDIMEEVVEEDVLSLLYLGGGMDSLAIAKLPLPNELGGRQIMEVSGDGMYAYILADDAAGSILYSVDLSDITYLRVADSLRLNETARAISLNPRGELLAIGKKGNEKIMFLRVENGKFTDQRSQSLNYDFEESKDITGIRWHGDGELFACVLDGEQIAFYEFDIFSGYAEILGAPYITDIRIVDGDFSKEGIYFMALGADESGAGEMISVHVDADEGNHYFSSRVDVGDNPSSFSLAPQGDYLVVTNLEQSASPGNDQSSLSLLSFDAKDGTVLQHFRNDIQGIMPMDVIFDPNGNSFVVALFKKNYGNGLYRGILDFRSLDRQSKRIVSTNFVFTMPPGLHKLGIAR